MAFKFIDLTRGYRAKVDAADYAVLNQHSWYVLPVDGHMYAARTVRVVGEKTKRSQYTVALMHRVVMGDIAKGRRVIHLNSDRLDNRRANLLLSPKASGK